MTTYTSGCVTDTDHLFLKRKTKKIQATIKTSRHLLKELSFPSNILCDSRDEPNMKKSHNLCFLICCSNQHYSDSIQ